MHTFRTPINELVVELCDATRIHACLRALMAPECVKRDNYYHRADSTDAIFVLATLLSGFHCDPRQVSIRFDKLIGQTTQCIVCLLVISCQILISIFICRGMKRIIIHARGA